MNQIWNFPIIDAPLSYKGSLYPLRNGFAQAADMDENLLTASLVSIEGKKEMIDAIAEFENNISTIQRHFCISLRKLVWTDPV